MPSPRKSANKKCRFQPWKPDNLFPMLLHITRLDFCEAYHLKRAVAIPPSSSVVIAEPVPWQRLPLAGIASLETSESVEKGVRRFSAKLSATLPERFALPERPLAFLLSCANGFRYLLGTANAPFPLAVQELRLPGNAAETSAVSLAVSGQCPVIRVIKGL